MARVSEHTSRVRVLGVALRQSSYHSTGIEEKHSSLHH